MIDTLFVTALVGGAAFAAIVGALRREPIEVVGGKPPEERETGSTPKSAPEEASS